MTRFTPCAFLDLVAASILLRYLGQGAEYYYLSFSLHLRSRRNYEVAYPEALSDFCGSSLWYPSFTVCGLNVSRRPDKQGGERRRIYEISDPKVCHTSESSYHGPSDSWAWTSL